MNVIVPTSVPLFVTPVLYKSPVPVEIAVFIQNGCPAAFILNVYVIPLTKVIDALAPLIAPVNAYAISPPFSTLKTVSNDSDV